MDFQKYLYGIAEMPSNWDSDALKAQAIAARSYAYKANKPICTTQSCQVFLKSKADNPPSSWKKAVDDTKGEILDNPKTSQYSSTTGGYINNVGWDINGKWPGDAYEKKAGSPWFYKAWYTKSYSSSDSCGRGNPWMTEKEMADILNAWVVWKSGNNSDRDRISPVTTSCWGGNPYSVDSMAKRADELGEKYGKVTSVDVDISSSGYTSKVTLGTDKGNVSMDGETFKTVFNLRAPGYVSIKSRLFDLEKR
jgi:peptidoglycan hydrolase-like amidase